MSLIDLTYFVDLIEIQGIKSTGSGISDAKAASLERYIADKEPKYIEMLFGYKPEQLPDDLAALLYNEVSRRSPIANYVFFYFMRNNATVNTISGEKIKVSEQSVNANPNIRLCAAWNEMVDMSVSALKSAIELGYSVPDDLSLIYDYFEIEAPIYDEDKTITFSIESPIFEYINEYGI